MSATLIASLNLRPCSFAQLCCINQYLFAALVFSNPFLTHVLVMKGILLGQTVLLLVFAIQTAMKCHATFCNDRQDGLLQDIRKHKIRCLHSDNKESPCCEAEESSLKERIQNHIILCGEIIIFECKKDLLLVIDASDSIEEDNFENKVQPFLMNFVKHHNLDVNRNGTRIAIMRFSTRQRTKIVLEFDKMYNAEEIAQKIGALKWDDVHGDKTRTETALQKANDEIFPEDNPYNIRSEIQDVIVLVTDGRPTNFPKAKAAAKVLKDKGILIVGAAIGPQRDQFMPQLEQLASGKEYVVKADFDKLNDVIGTIILKSCVRPADCECRYDTESGPISVPLGQSKVEVAWPKPSPSCRNKASPNINGETVSPNGITSPHMFGVGEHTITYTFTLNGDVTVDCPVLVKVTGELCGSIAYNPGSHVCCCGEIYRKNAGNNCCGKFYYNSRSQTCCDQTRGNLVSTTGESCPRETKAAK